MFVLIDSRHGLKAIDRKFLEALEKAKTKYQIILTKCDKVNPLELAKRHYQTRELLTTAKHNAGDPMIVSSHNKGGLSKLRRVISNILRI